MIACFDKIYGCISGSQIGSALGAPVENWTHEEIEREYGVLDQLIGYAHYQKNDRGGGRDRPPGTTEDGIERQRLMCTAIVEKSGRITCQDLARVWVRDIDPDNFGVQMQPTDATMFKLMQAGEGFEVEGYQRIGHYSFFPASEVGRYTVAPGTVAFARSCQPVGIINAFDPQQAAEDALELGRMYVPPNDVALFWGAAVAAGIAEAIKPGATVDSVLEMMKKLVPAQIWLEIEEGLNVANRHERAIDMWQTFNTVYINTAGFNPLSKAHEIVTKAVAIFYKTRGHTREGLIAAVNFGRDTDCLSAIVGGLCGALTGMESIPAEWVETVDRATSKNRHTVSNLSLKETAIGLNDALRSELTKQQDRIRYWNQTDENTV